jgi:hypothetical protein
VPVAFPPGGAASRVLAAGLAAVFRVVPLLWALPVPLVFVTVARLAAVAVTFRAATLATGPPPGAAGRVAALMRPGLPAARLARTGLPAVFPTALSDPVATPLAFFGFSSPIVVLAMAYLTWSRFSLLDNVRDVPAVGASIASTLPGINGRRGHGMREDCCLSTCTIHAVAYSGGYQPGIDRDRYAVAVHG